MKQFGTSLLISVLAGVFQFLGQLLLARQLSEGGYSEIALVLSLIANYLLLTDLGTQIFFARYIAPKSFVDVAEVHGFLGTRAALGLLVLALGTLHLKLLGLNGLHLVSGSFLLLSASAISLLQVFEIIGYRTVQPVWSQASRLLRGSAWVTFSLAQIIILKKFPERFTVLTLMNVFSGLMFLISVGMISYLISKKGPFQGFLTRQTTANELFGFSQIKSILNAAIHFSTQTLKTPQYTFGFALSWATHVLTSLSMTEIWSKNGLSQFFLAQNLLNPVALSVQIVSNSILSHSEFRVTKQSKSVIAALLFAVFFGSISLYFMPWICQWAVPSFSSTTAVELLLQALGVTLPAVGTLLFIREFQVGQRRWMTLGPGIGFFCSFILWIAVRMNQTKVGLESMPKSLIWSTLQCTPTLGYFLWRFTKSNKHLNKNNAIL